MSLRPKHAQVRSRSKSPAVGNRIRSSSNVSTAATPSLATAPSPSLASASTAYSGYAPPPPPPMQYQIGSPTEHAPYQISSPTSPHEQIATGGYTDLPPHERPAGYAPLQQAGAGGYQQYQTTSGTPTHTHPPPLPYQTGVEGQQQQSWSYTAQPQHGSATGSRSTTPIVGPGSGVRSAMPGSFNYTAPTTTTTATAAFNYTATPQTMPTSMMAHEEEKRRQQYAQYYQYQQQQQSLEQREKAQKEYIQQQKEQKQAKLKAQQEQEKENKRMEKELKQREREYKIREKELALQREKDARREKELKLKEKKLQQKQQRHNSTASASSSSKKTRQGSLDYEDKIQRELDQQRLQYKTDAELMPPPPPPPPMTAGQQQQYGQYPPPPPVPQPYGVNANVVEMAPGQLGRIASPPSPNMRPHMSHRMSSGGSSHHSRGDPHLSTGALAMPAMPGDHGLSGRMNRLSVSGNRPDLGPILPPGQLPPASPFLEPYHGTYQSISPMPSPIMMPAPDLDDLPPLDHTLSGGYGGYASGGEDRGGGGGGISGWGNDRLSMALSRQTSNGARSVGGSSSVTAGGSKKRVKIYDAAEDAEALVAALNGKQVDPDPIIDILTALTHDQMLELRNEYKRHCKIQGRGINVAKHIKLKTTGNFGKAAYVTALGRWESEAYWANFWYQQQSSKRELLIEALMGRGNAEMRAIKSAFRDKRYDDDLARCMEKELRADKFRAAVLLALEARRQEETEVWSVEDRNRDVETLAHLMRKGGETEMIRLVVLRSDNHLREVLRAYERKYGENFARAALRRSNNLVGELLAHILNGVINKPSRDAMLLHHAIMDLLDSSDPAKTSSATTSNGGNDKTNSKHERQQRYELLISRLTRLHWDRLHLLRVKEEYREKYDADVEDDLEDALRGDLREFALALCATK